MSARIDPFQTVSHTDEQRCCGKDGGTTLSVDLKTVTELIEAHRNGEADAYDQAIEALYSELHRIAQLSRRKLGGNPTLQTTAIVHEAYLKLKNSPGGARNSAHFLNIAARAMRQIIVDYARARLATKRGGDVVHLDIASADPAIQSEVDQVLLIDGALTRLASHHPQLARVFEFKFFTGLNDDELAHALDLPKRTAQREWMKARAFIADYLTERE